MSYQEFPRTLHKPEGVTLTVHDEVAKLAALDEGWALSPVLNGAVIDFDEAADDAPKRKAGRPKKDA